MVILPIAKVIPNFKQLTTSQWFQNKIEVVNFWIQKFGWKNKIFPYDETTGREYFIENELLSSFSSVLIR